MAGRSLSVRGMVYASVFGAATAVGAFLVVPLPPIPMTLQTFFLAVAAGLLGGNLGALSQVVYVLLGIMGLPVFAGGKAGFGVLLGPTGGYLIGFIAGAYVIGRLIHAGKRTGFLKAFLCMAVGTMVIYAFGITHLCLAAKMTLQKALAVGMIPFLFGDALKMILAAVLVVKVRESAAFRSLLGLKGTTEARTAP